MVPSPSFPTPSILIADADGDIRQYMAGCLQAVSPVRIWQAADGREAFYLARALRPHLVISSDTLAGLDGAALCRALGAEGRTQGIPVLIVSSEERAAGPGDGLLVAPFNAARLQAEVERLLGRPLTPQKLLP